MRRTVTDRNATPFLANEYVESDCAPHVLPIHMRVCRAHSEPVCSFEYRHCASFSVAAVPYPRVRLLPPVSIVRSRSFRFRQTHLDRQLIGAVHIRVYGFDESACKTDCHQDRLLR